MEANGNVNEHGVHSDVSEHGVRFGFKLDGEPPRVIEIPFVVVMDILQFLKTNEEELRQRALTTLGDYFKQAHERLAACYDEEKRWRREMERLQNGGEAKGTSCHYEPSPTLRDAFAQR